MDGSFRFLLVGFILILSISAYERKQKIAHIFQEYSICMKESEALEKCVNLKSVNGGKCEAQKSLIIKILNLNIFCCFYRYFVRCM